MQVHVIKTPAGNNLLHKFGGAVGGETNPTAQPFFLPLTRKIEASAGAEGPFEQFPVVDPVKGKEIDPRKSQAREGSSEDLFKFLWIGLRADLRLENEFLPGNLL